MFDVDPVDADNVLRVLVRDKNMRDILRREISYRLLQLEGFPDLPADLRRRIEEQGLFFYASGYLHAMGRRE